MESKNFEKHIANKLKDLKFKKKSFKFLDDFPLIIGKQALYVMDWQNSENVYQRGVKELLGYDHNEFQFDIVLNYFHADDLNIMRRIIKGSVEHCAQQNYKGKNEYLHIKHRVQKKDETYILLLRQTQKFESTHNGRLKSTLSLVTDISFVSSTKVEWEIYANKLDRKEFKKSIYKEFSDFFTSRELEIISLIKQGLNSKNISDRLFISPHTVATHRKNILKKSNCHSSKELLEFCGKNGIPLE